MDFLDYLLLILIGCSLIVLFSCLYVAFGYIRLYSETELIGKAYVKVGHLVGVGIEYSVYCRKKEYRLPNRKGIYKTINDLEEDYHLKFYCLENLSCNQIDIVDTKKEILNIHTLDIKIINKIDLQQKLDNYWNGTIKKSKEDIGRDYERYIGYLYERDGFKVNYQGIKMKLEDGGIDLICQKADIIHLVQCKNWGKDKIIHEKHINQLYGACSVYMKRKKVEVTPVFYTTINLSDEAKSIANELGVVIMESIFLDKEYPSIKCNIGKNGEKIFHVPWSPYYDITKITKKGECYVRTVKEAEDLGFKSVI